MTLLVSTKQFKMYLDSELVERLENMAAKSGRRSAQQVAEEVLEFYLPLWSAVVDATSRAVNYQASKETEAFPGQKAPVVAHIGRGEMTRDEIREQLRQGIPMAPSSAKQIPTKLDETTTTRKRRAR